MAMTANDGGVGGSGDNQTYKLYRHLKTLPQIILLCKM